MSQIETRLFRYFVVLAEEQHFSRAALRLGITPPTLTHQIKKLERQLAAKLLERKGNTHVVLTDAGQRFFDRAREVLRHVEEAAATVQQAERGELGRLEIGFMTSVSYAGLLQNWIGPFQQGHQAIDITIRKMVPMAQVVGIARKELDAGFTRPPHKYPPGVRGFEVYRQPMVLALPSEHSLARHSNISPAMLMGETFVKTTLGLDAGFFGYTEAVAGIGKFMPRVAKRDDDFITVLAYVALGYGIAVVPELMKRMNVPNVVFRNIASNPVPQTSIAFVYSGDPSPSANLLIEHMQRYALRNRGKGGTAPIRIAS